MLGPEIVFNQAALRHNAQQIRRLVAPSRVLAVVKANAYGHGLEKVVPALTDLVDGFAVARITEADKIRQLGWLGPLVLFSGLIDEDDWLWAEKNRIAVVVHQQQHIDMLKTKRFSMESLWLELDSGLGRLGFSPSDYLQALAQLEAAHLTDQIVLMTHLGNAEYEHDVRNQEQLHCFHQLTAASHWPKSWCNSAAMMYQAAGDWVRPGLALYGIYPAMDGDRLKIPGLDLQPVMTFRAPIIAIRDMPAGHGIGYNTNYVCPRDTTIACVACGYGDGYPRTAYAWGHVYVHEQLVPILGRVSMDLMAIDVGTLPHCRVGDWVELWGEHVPVQSLTRTSERLAYELLCGVRGRT